jgi:hypothetical protein
MKRLHRIKPQAFLDAKKLLKHPQGNYFGACSAIYLVLPSLALSERHIEFFRVANGRKSIETFWWNLNAYGLGKRRKALDIAYHEAIKYEKARLRALKRK